MDSCSGKLDELFALPTFSFQFATIFGGIAVVAAFLTIACLIFMLFLKSTTVFHICGWMQLLSGKFYLKKITPRLSTLLHCPINYHHHYKLLINMLIHVTSLPSSSSSASMWSSIRVKYQKWEVRNEWIVNTWQQRWANGNDLSVDLKVF